MAVENDSCIFAEVFAGFYSGACIVKLITAEIYSFRSKLECLSLASLSSLV